MFKHTHQPQFRRLSVQYLTITQKKKKTNGCSAYREFLSKKERILSKWYSVSNGERVSSNNAILSLTYTHHFSRSLDASSPLRYKQLGRGWGTSKHNCLVSYLLCWRRHVSANVGHLQVTKMYRKENYTEYDHTYSFLSIYSFVTLRWPTVAETCRRQHNK